MGGRTDFWLGLSPSARNLIVTPLQIPSPDKSPFLLARLRGPNGRQLLGARLRRFSVVADPRREAHMEEVTWRL